jgi:hypothetical protein
MAGNYVFSIFQSTVVVKTLVLSKDVLIKLI